MESLETQDASANRCRIHIYINPKINVLCAAVLEILKNKFFLFWMAAIFNIAKMVEESKCQVAAIKILK